MVCSVGANYIIDTLRVKETSVTSSQYRDVCLNYLIYNIESGKTLISKKMLGFLEDKVNYLPKNISILKNITSLQGFLLYKKVALFLSHRPLSCTFNFLYTDKCAFHEVVHTILRGYSNPETTPLQEKYGRLDPQYHAFKSTQKAFDLLKQTVIFQNQCSDLTTHQEQESLLRICTDRYNHFTYVRMLEAYVEAPEDSQLKGEIRKKLIDYITNSILFLYNPDYPSITLLENGSTCFSILGGWHNHYVGFQFIRDTTGSYYFTLENRDKFSQDPRFHGLIGFSYQNKSYTRSRVHIKVELDSILDPNFLLFLINDAHGYYERVTSTSVYNFLYSHLIEKGKGKIIQTEHGTFQTMVEIAKRTLNSIFIKQLNKFFCNHLRSNKAYQRVQIFNTCLKSNTRGREGEMASLATREVLERYESRTLTKELKIKYCFKLTKGLARPPNYSDLRASLNRLKLFNSAIFKSSSFLIRLDEVVNQWADCQEHMDFLNNQENAEHFGLGDFYAKEKAKTAEEKIDIENKLVALFEELDEATILFKHSLKRMGYKKNKNVISKQNIQRTLS